MVRIILKDHYRWSKLWHQALLNFRRRIRHRIFSAIERGDDAKALRLATKRILLRSRGEFSQSPLVAAIAAGRVDLARDFILRGGVYAGDGSIAHAAMRGDLAVVEMLLEANKNPDEPLPKDEFNVGYTPLMWATNRHYLPVVRALLAAGANVDAVARDGTTAVMCTLDAAPASLEALEILCSYKPDITKKDWRGRNLIREARDRERCSGKPEMRQILERYFPDTDFDAV